MSQSLFDQTASEFEASGAENAMETLASRLKTEGRLHELFDLRLMQTRIKHGLPVTQSPSLDELPESLRNILERAYLDACRESGWGLMEKGQIREAWMYLRPLGETSRVAEALEKIEPTEENLEPLVEVALHEGAATKLGLDLVLSHFGTCNAITVFDAVLAQRPLAVRQTAAGQLVRHLHAELFENVKLHVAREEGTDPAGATLEELIAPRDWLFSQYSYHIDSTHLNSVVRSARIVVEPEILALAFDLTEYGRRLHEQFQFAGEEPFAEVYPSHGLFYAAQLGRRADEAVTYFREKAAAHSDDLRTTLPAEVFVTLLARLKRWPEAIDAWMTWIPNDRQTQGFAPSLYELCHEAGDFSAMLQRCRERNDPVGFTAALVSQTRHQTPGT
jgi:hypothetical protein